MQTLVNENGAHVWRIQKWIDTTKATALAENLKVQLPWEVQKLVIFGKEFDEPRRTYVCGEPGLIHKYSGAVRPLNPWIPAVKQVKDRIQTEFGYNLNSCLLNEYATGSNCIGWHADKELMPPENIVCTVSLGGPRDFYLRRKFPDKSDTTGQVNDFKLKMDSGDLLVMEGTTQEHWIHTVPKRAKANYRISLTFRIIKS